MPMMHLFPTSIYTHMFIILVDGNWGDWFSFSECSASCGDGQQSRYRICNNPPALNGGLHCLSSDKSGNRGNTETLTQSCNVKLCPGKLSLRRPFSIRILITLFDCIY